MNPARRGHDGEWGYPNDHRPEGPASLARWRKPQEIEATKNTRPGGAGHSGEWVMPK